MSVWRWALLVLAALGSLVLSLVVAHFVGAAVLALGASDLVIAIARCVAAGAMGALGSWCVGSAHRIWTRQCDGIAP